MKKKKKNNTKKKRKKKKKRRRSVSCGIVVEGGIYSPKGKPKVLHDY